MKENILSLIIILSILQNTTSAQIDFKIEHIYDSLSVRRIQLPKSKRIRYIGREFLYDSLSNIKDVDISQSTVTDKVTISEWGFRPNKADGDVVFRRLK